MGEMSVNFGDQPLRTQSLHQLVGYAELIKAAGVSRSTIERAWRGPWDDGEPQLPKPGKIGSRSVWVAQVINEWLLSRAQWQSGVLASFAKVDADDLSPEQLEGEAIALVVKAMEKRAGTPVDAGDLGIHVTRQLSEGDFRDAERREFANYSDRFSDFDATRACVMAAWLFPRLRTIIERSVPDNEKPMYRGSENLEYFGGAALHDDIWDELMVACGRPK